jgi:hypothetical protein
MDEQQAYTFRWQHGPAPGLTYYSGTEVAYGDSIEEAERRARRAVAQRGCFSPGCLTFTHSGGDE